MIGESIAISAEFDNRSSRSVIPYASLYQLQTFFANGKSRIRGTKFTVLTGKLSNKVKTFKKFCTNEIVHLCS